MCQYFVNHSNNFFPDLIDDITAKIIKYFRRMKSVIKIINWVLKNVEKWQRQ